MADFAAGFVITLLLSIFFGILYFKSKRSNQKLLESNIRFEAEINLAKSSEMDAPTMAKAIASDINKEQNTSFKATTIDPITGMIEKLQTKINDLEKQNASDREAFDVEIKNMLSKTTELAKGTKSLSDVLKSSQKRGKHAEIGLERVFEMSGLTKGVHYDTQSIGTDGTPDFVIHISDDRSIIVDSKSPLESLWNAFETDDDATKTDLLKKHAQAVKGHILKLSNKEYWNDQEQSLDYVVMVMPEYAMLPALEQDNKLAEYALSKRIVLVTPSTLMLLLRAVKLMWRQTQLSSTVKEITNVSVQLHERMNKFANHYNKTGKDLTETVNSYNNAIKSWNSRILPAATKLIDVTASADDIEKLKSIRDVPKQLPIDDE